MAGIFKGIAIDYSVLLSPIDSAMGQSLGSLRSHTIVRREGSLKMEEELPPDMLEFSPEQSQMVSYGIDRQTHPKFCDKTLTEIVKYDAEAMSLMFRKTGEG